MPGDMQAPDPIRAQMMAVFDRLPRPVRDLVNETGGTPRNMMEITQIVRRRGTGAALALITRCIEPGLAAVLRRDGKL